MLDGGCGPGEHALHIAETALAIARQKAIERGIEAEFVTADALRLGDLGRTFRTALDCGLFHTFDADERSRYGASLASVIEHGGTVYVLCFSDDGPGTGPHPISQAELKAAFSPSRGWNVVAIESGRVETRFHDHVEALA